MQIFNWVLNTPLVIMKIYGGNKKLKKVNAFAFRIALKQVNTL